MSDGTTEAPISFSDGTEPVDDPNASQEETPQPQKLVNAKPKQEAEAEQEDNADDAETPDDTSEQAADSADDQEDSESEGDDTEESDEDDGSITIGEKSYTEDEIATALKTHETYSARARAVNEVEKKNKEDIEAATKAVENYTQLNQFVTEVIGLFEHGDLSDEQLASMDAEAMKEHFSHQKQSANLVQQLMAKQAEINAAVDPDKKTPDIAANEVDKIHALAQQMMVGDDKYLEFASKSNAIKAWNGVAKILAEAGVSRSEARMILVDNFSKPYMKILLELHSLRQEKSGDKPTVIKKKSKLSSNRNSKSTPGKGLGIPKDGAEIDRRVAFATKQKYTPDESNAYINMGIKPKR
ncbi:MAG: hypothetical protein ACR2N8_03000 [Parvibaculales bacterium]